MTNIILVLTLCGQIQQVIWFDKVDDKPVAKYTSIEGIKNHKEQFLEIYNSRQIEFTIPMDNGICS